MWPNRIMVYRTHCWHTTSYWHMLMSYATLIGGMSNGLWYITHQYVAGICVIWALVDQTNPKATKTAGNNSDEPRHRSAVPFPSFHFFTVICVWGVTQHPCRKSNNWPSVLKETLPDFVLTTAVVKLPNPAAQRERQFKPIMCFNPLAFQSE